MDKKRIEEIKALREKTKNRVLEAKAPSALESLNSRLQKYADDSYSFSNQYKNRFYDEEGNYLNQYRSDSSDWLKTVRSKNNYFSSESDAIKNTLEMYKAYIPEESYKEISDMLATNSKALSDIYSTSRSDNDYWSQWESEDAYKQYLANAEEQEKLLTYDLEEGKNKIAEAKKKLDWAINERDNYVYDPLPDNSQWLKDYTTPEAKARAKEEMRLKEIDARYAWVRMYEDELRDAELYYTKAERAQNAHKLASVSNPESEYYDSEFERYAQMGEAISVPSMFDASAYNGDIQNPAKYARENWEANGKSEKWLENDYKAYEDFNIDTRYLKMTDDEYKTYNYYLAKDSENARKGKESNLADEYFASIEESLNARLGSEMGDAAKEKGAVYETLFGLAMGAKTNLESLGTIFSKEDYIPTTVYQAANQIVAEDMSKKTTTLPDWLGGGEIKTGEYAYQASNVIGNMLPSIAIGAATGGLGGLVGGTAGTILTIGGQIAANAEMGLSAAGNAYQGMLNEGYNKDQARLYGGLVGASEATLQYLLGGISSMGGKLSGGVLSKALSKVDSALGRFAIKYAGSIGSEILEEELQLFVEPFLKTAIFDLDYDAPNIDEMLDTAIITFFSTGLLEGPGVVMGEVNTRNDGKAIQEEGKVDRLVELGKLYSVDTVAYQLAKKVDENTGAYTIGRLLNEVNASLSEQNRTDIKNALTKKGVSEAQAETLAKWMNHVVEGGTLTEKQQVALESNDVLSEVLYGTIIQANSTVMQRSQLHNRLYDIASSMGVDRNALEKTQTPEAISQSINQRRAVGEAMRRGAAKSGLSSEQLAAIDSFATKSRTAIPEANYQDVGQNVSNEPSSVRIADTTGKVSDTGSAINTATGEDVSIKGIASIDTKNKTMMLELADGTKVNSKDISYESEEQAALYESVLNMGYTPQVANSLIRGYTPNSNISVADYLIGTNEAFHYGWGHIPEKGRTGINYKMLNNAQREHAVKVGEEARAADDKTRGLKASQNQPQTSKKKDKGGYGVRFTAGENAITNRVKASVKALDAVAKALKLNITVADLHGNAYGYYNASTNELIIDVNAGGNGKHTLLFTASHELVHYIRNWSPTKFTVLADFLMEQYVAKGENVDALIQAEIDKAYKATRGKHEMTYEEAYEEVVAQAMQGFLTDSNFIERLASLQKKDASLAKRLVSKLKDILKNIRTAYQGMNPNDRASQAVKEMGEAIDELYAKMEEGLIAASEASQSIGARNLEDYSEAKNTNGEELFQYKAMEEDEETYRQMLKKHGKMSENDINKLFSTIDKALVIIKNNLEVLDYAWEADIDDRSFSPVKPNSDNLYKVSLDFSTLCRKRILQQVIQTQLQDALNKPLSREESIAIRDELMKIQEEGRQIEIACALCYVESARMKSPAQIKKFLKDRENVIKEFLASKSGGDIKQKIKQAESDARERLGVGNATLKSMPDKIAEQIRTAKREAKKAYSPTAEEQKLIDAALSMTVTDFTSPEGLGNLAKNYPVLFDAYTSYVRNATKSKGIEKDTWWRAGDSDSIGDTLIANMNRENGLRSQSWSDFQVIHMLDYIAATIELSTRNAKEQAYSKVPDYIDLMGNTGVMLNMSLIPTAQFNGKLEYDSVEGMAYKKALELREKYHATAGTICIGISDEQIKMLLDDSSIDYVIPYHKSGMAAHIRKLMHIPTWSEYEKYQNETNLTRDEALKQAKKYGVKLLSESDENYQKHTAFSEWFDIEEARQITEQENAFPSDAKLQKKLGKMYGGYMAMQNAANNYLKLCAERGIAPKFSHENANFTEEANYWKLIIDRKMVDNVTGEIIEQQAIKPIFDEAEVLRILNDELERYPNVKADQDYATRTVVEKFLSGKMNDRLDADTIAAIMQKPVDNIATTNIIASEDDVKAQYADNKKYAVSESFANSLLNGFGIEGRNIGDSVHVQKHVFATLMEEGFFTNKSLRNRIDVNKESGMVVEINKSSIDETFSKDNYARLGKFKKYAKLATIRELPVAIRDGHLIDDNVPNSHKDGTTNKSFAYIEYKTNIDGIDVKLKLAIKKSPQKNKFWVHSVYNIENISSYPASTEIGTEAGYRTADIGKIVTQDTNSVKTNQENSPTDLKAQYIDAETDQTYMDAVKKGDIETAQKMVDEAAKRAGFTIKAYHGTNADFTVFDKNRVGKGIDQYGAGFYFASNPDVTEAYGKKRYDTYLNIKKPINLITKSGDAGKTLYDVHLTQTQAYQILKRHPLMYDAENSPLGDFYDEYWEVGAKEWMVRDLAKKYDSIGFLDGDVILYRDYPNELHEAIRDVLGYDGVRVYFETDAMVDERNDYYYVAWFANQIKSSEPVAKDDNGNIIPLSKRFNSENDDIRYQYADIDAIDNRTLLAKALEGAAKNDIEKAKLKEYQTKIELINAEEKKVRELKAKIKEISFSKGMRDTEKLKKLQFEANQATNRINVYDKQLLRLEATKPLMDVVQREKALVRKKMEQERKEAVKAAKEKSMATIREIMDRNTESRKKAIEGRNKTQVRQKIKNVVGELNQLLLKGSKERNIKLGLQPAVASALKAINMDTVAADERVAKYNDLIAKAKDPDVIASLTETRDRIQSQGDVMKGKLEALRDAYTEIEEKGNEFPEYYRAEADLIKNRIESVIQKVGNTPLRNMSLSQLESVYELYSMVLATVRNANAVFVEGKLQDLQQNASDVMNELTKIKARPEERIDSGWVDRFSWNEMIPVYAFKRMGSQTFEKFFWETIRGQDTVARDLEEANDFASETREKYGYKKWDFNKVHEFKLSDGRTFRITLKHMMSIYAYSKREQALDHMSTGGFFFNDKETFRKKGGVLKVIKKNEVGYCVDSNILQTIIGAMTDNQKLYVNEMQEYLTKMGDKGNEVSRVIWGIDIFKEKVYFPLKSVKDFIYQANQPAQESSLKNDGMTKETKPGASNPIVLESFDDVWANHVNRMSQYHGLVIPIDNLNKVHNYGTWAGTDSMSVSTMLGARFGEAVNDYLSQFIKDMNGASSTSGASNPFFGFVSKFKKTAVAASTSVVVQQPTAILRATAVMDAKYFVGMPETKKLATKWEELKQYAPIAVIKEIGGFDAGAGRQATAWLNTDTLTGVDKVMNKVDDLAMMGAAIGDQIGWCAIWEAAKREIKATTNLKEESKEFFEKAGKRFTEVVVLTQVYDSTLSRSGFMRSKHDSVKMLTSFMGEPTVSANMMFDAVVQAKRGTITKRNAGRIIAATYAAILAASVAASLVYALRDDDDDESYLEKLMESLGGKLIGDINPLNMLPGFRDILSILDGWEVERTDIAIFKDIYDAIDSIGSDTKSTQRKIEDLSGAFAALFGLPLKNVLRTTREVYNGVRFALDDIKPTGAGEAFVRGITGEKMDKSKALYDAIVSGDNARIKRYKEGYKDEKSYQTALRKALRENDERITEAAQARLDGDATEYKQIAREIVSEGFFTQDDVVAAINAAMRQLDEDSSSNDSESDEDNKATSYYTSSDINSALENGDTTTALKVIDDIVQVKTENYISDGCKKSEAKKKAEASVKSSVSSYWKPLYLKAKANKNLAEVTRIKKLLKATKLYDNVTETTDDWWVEYKKTKK